MCGVNIKFELVGKSTVIREYMLKSSYHVNNNTLKVEEKGYGDNVCTYTALSHFQKF